ncbi:MAG: 50S ribosomal protein L1 [Alphaproteobacteria bacterium CG_4_10_14_0_8_um_filter_53_9]|nr:MAG: 50S ribosomal protein L1 [Alphaproteobacteria bacterium CG_4_10_14_0_8_um_filter_53_9]
MTQTKRSKAMPEFDRMKTYDLKEAITLLKSMPKSKFDESVDIAFNLAVDPKYNDQMVRATVLLPHGNGKTVRVAVFAKGDAAEAAKKAGADIVGAEDLVAQVEKGIINFDRVIAAPDCMPLVGRVGKILGPKGMMPNPKLGTVTPNVAKAVQDVKSGMIEFKVEKAGIVHAGVGRLSFDEKKLAENIQALVKAVKDAKPSGAKTNYLQRLAVSSTMGPGIKIDITSV